MEDRYYKDQIQEQISHMGASDCVFLKRILVLLLRHNRKKNRSIG